MPSLLLALYCYCFDGHIHLVSEFFHFFLCFIHWNIKFLLTPETSLKIPWQFSVCVWVCVQCYGLKIVLHLNNNTNTWLSWWPWQWWLLLSVILVVACVKDDDDDDDDESFKDLVNVDQWLNIHLAGVFCVVFLFRL